VAATPGDAGGAYDAKARDIFSIVIGRDCHPMSQSLESCHLRQDADVTAIVGEKGGGGDD